MGAGRILAIIGGILGILSVVLFFILPEFFCFWRIEISGGGMDITTYLGGIGFGSGSILGIPFGPELVDDIILLLVGVLTIAGGVIALIGGAADKKTVGILGGIILLAGPILLIVSILGELGAIGDLAAILPPGETAFFGSISSMGVTATWGIWIGFFMAIAGGVVGVIGGAII